MPITSLDEVTVLGLSNTDPNYIKITADMSSATWNADATHEILIVTGVVHVKIVCECVATLTDTAGNGTISLGIDTDADLWIADTDSDTVLTATLWYNDTPATNNTTTTVVIDKIVSGADIGYEIDGEALTGGTMAFHCWWEPISTGSSVTAGAGGVLA